MGKGAARNAQLGVTASKSLLPCPETAKQSAGVCLSGTQAAQAAAKQLTAQHEGRKFAGGALVYGGLLFLAGAAPHALPAVGHDLHGRRCGHWPGAAAAAR